MSDPKKYANTDDEYVISVLRSEHAMATTISANVPQECVSNNRDVKSVLYRKSKNAELQVQAAKTVLVARAMTYVQDMFLLMMCYPTHDPQTNGKLADAFQKHCETGGNNETRAVDNIANWIVCTYQPEPEDTWPEYYKDIVDKLYTAASLDVQNASRGNYETACEALAGALRLIPKVTEPNVAGLMDIVAQQLRRAMNILAMAAEPTNSLSL